MHPQIATELPAYNFLQPEVEGIYKDLVRIIGLGVIDAVVAELEKRPQLMPKHGLVLIRKAVFELEGDLATALIHFYRDLPEGQLPGFRQFCGHLYSQFTDHFGRVSVLNSKDDQFHTQMEKNYLKIVSALTSVIGSLAGSYI